MAERRTRNAQVPSSILGLGFISKGKKRAVEVAVIKQRNAAPKKSLMLKKCIISLNYLDPRQA